MTILKVKISKHYQQNWKAKSGENICNKWQELLYLMYEEFLKLFFLSHFRKIQSRYEEISHRRQVEKASKYIRILTFSFTGMAK